MTVGGVSVLINDTGRKCVGQPTVTLAKYCNPLSLRCRPSWQEMALVQLAGRY